MASARGCGTREAGGIYLVVGTSPFGKPFEEFLFDPPMVLPLEELGVKPRGVSIIQFPGRPVYDVVDWVGANNYPNASDVVEEGIKFLRGGESPISRRISRAEDFKLLTPGSKIILIHPRALMTNFMALDTDLNLRLHREGHADCKTHKIGHAQRPARSEAGHTEMCIRLWWHDILEGKSTGVDGDVSRTLGSTSYHGYAAPPKFKGEYVPAAIGAFPIARLEIIQSDEEEDELNMSKVEGCALPCAMVRD